MNAGQGPEAGLITVNLGEVDEGEGPCCMSYGFDLDPLRTSIEEVGIINPPFVALAGDGKVIPVTGYRRLLAMKSLGRSEVSCRLFSDRGFYPLEGLLFNLYDNLGTRSFNDVEKGMILSRLARHLPRDRVLKTYMPLLDLPARGATLDLLLEVEALEKPLKNILAEKRASLQAIKALMDLEPEARSPLTEWFIILKLNINQQIKLIEYILDISVIEGKDICELMRDPSLRMILEDDKANPPQKAKQVLDHLRRRRLPRLTLAESTFRKRIAGLRMPTGVSIRHSPFFEDSEYTLEIGFRDGKSLKEKIRALEKSEGLEELGDPWGEVP